MASVTVSWIDSSADWNTPADWSDAIVPNSTNDIVVLPGSGAYTVTISSGESFTVGSVIVTDTAAALALDDGALTVTGGFTNSGTLNVDDTATGEGGSSLTVDGTLDNTAIVQVGPNNLTLGAPTTLTLGGLSNGAGASFAIDGSASHAATLAFSGGAGSFTSNGGFFQLAYAAPLTLDSSFTNSGTFNLILDSALTVTGGFTNSGTLNVDDTANGEGGSSLTVDGTLDNTAIVQVGPNNLTLGAPTTLTLGGLSNGAGASFAIDGSASHAATLAFSGGAGSFTSNGGFFQLAYAAPLTLDSSFTNSGTFNLILDSALTVTGGFTNSGTLNVDDTANGEGGSSLTVDGTLDNTAIVQVGPNNLTLGAPTTLTLGGLSNGAGASFAIDGSASHAATLAFSGGAGSFTSNGGFFQLAYAAPLTLDSSFTNSGTFNLILDSALTVTGGFTNSGTLNVDDTATGEGGSSLTVDGTLDNTAIVQVGPNNLTLGAPTTLTLGGLSNGAGASFAIDGSASHAATLAFSGGAGSFTSNGGFFQLAYAAPLTLDSSFTNSGTFNLILDSALTVTGGFTNSGTLNVDDTANGEGGSSLTVDGTLDNTAIVQVGPNNLTLGAPTTLTLGGLSNGAGASFAIDGSASHAATLAFSGGAGSFTSNGGFFQLAYAAPLTLDSSFTNSGTFNLILDSALTVTGGFTNSGTLNVDDTATGEGGSSLTVDGTLDNTAIVQVGPNNLTLGAPTTLTLGGLSNGAGASFAIDGSASHAATLAFSGGAGSFTSNGGFFQLAYAAPLTLDSSFTNSGTFNLILDSALTVTGGFTNSGTLNVDDTANGEGGSSLTVDGTLDNTAVVQVGPNNLTLGAPTTLTLGGLSNGAGASFAIDGSASHAAMLAFSGGAGSFTSNGGFFQLAYAAPLTLDSSFTNSGTFNLILDSALTVTGGFTNSGTLNVDDTANGEGGSSLTVDGTLDNTAIVQVGPNNLTLGAPTTLTLGGLSNGAGASFAIDGSASHAAMLAFSGGAGSFTSNGGFFQLAYAAPLTLDSSFTNSGTFNLILDSALTVTGGFTNSGTLNVDDTATGEGGSSLTVDGTLDNTGTVQVGPNNLTLGAPTTVTLGGLINGTGDIFAVDGSASHAATLTVAGPASNAGNLNIGSFSVFDVTGGNAFTQTGGTTTVNGMFAAATIDIDGGALIFNTTNFTNTGTLAAADGGVINFSAGGLTNLSAETLTGGVYIVDAGSTLQLPNNATIVTLAADLTLSGTGSVVEGLNTTTSKQVPLESTLTTIATGGALDVLGGRSYTTANTLTDAGALQIAGGGTFTAAGLSVAGGAVASVDAGSSLDLSSPMSVSGTLINAGTVSGGGATAVTFASSTDRLILDPGATFTGTVVGGGANTTLELAQGSGPGTLDALGTAFVNFGTVIVDPEATWTVEAFASVLAGATITGSGGSNLLDMLSAGTFSLGEVSQFPAIDLASGNNTVTVTDTTLSGGSVTIRDGASSNNNVSAASDTAASKGKNLYYVTGTGTDTFTGGLENDTVTMSAAALASDTLTGGSGANVLKMTSAGTFSLGRVSRFANVYLAAGNNTVTVTDTTLSGGSVTISDGASGNNSVSAASDTAASKGKNLYYATGSGTDSFTGGFENDTVTVSAAAVSSDVLTGGSGVNALKLTDAGTFSLGGVSHFANIYLAVGNSTVTVTDTTLSAGSVTLHDGASSNNSISAAGDTAASKGKTVYYVTGTGTDSFAGGFENDTIYIAATVVGGDTLTGGSGANALVLTNAGTFSLGGVSHFANILLTAGNNTVTVTDTTLAGGSVTISDGASGNNSISAAGDTVASKAKNLYYVAGTGTDSFTGGFENDTIYVAATAVGGDTLTGGSGANALVLTNAGTFSLGGVSHFANIFLTAGNNTATVTDTTLSGGSVTINAGVSGDEEISAAGDTAASKAKNLYIVAGTGPESFTGGFENDTVYVAATAVGGDTLTGGSGANALVLTNAGTFSLGGVSRFANIYLAAGNNTVTVTDTTLSGGSVTISDGASGNNSISAVGDTAASVAKNLYYVTGTGTDGFIGGFENDTVTVSAAAVGGDVLAGGSGANALKMTTAGTFSLGGVSHFATINLAAGNNNVTVTDTTLSGGSVTISDGASGNNSISAAADTAASKGKNLYYVAGTGTDSFTGGFENDTIYAGTGLGTFTAGSGSDKFVFIADNLPNQTLDNFQVSADDLMVYGIHATNGFDLGPTDNALNPTVPMLIDPTIFVANASGDFTSSSQRFAYNTANGDLFYSATGSNTSEKHVATLATFTGAPPITANNILFLH